MNDRKVYLIINRWFGVIALSIMAVVLLYFLIAPRIHHTNALVPSQMFLYTVSSLLLAMLAIYFVVFIIKIVAVAIHSKKLISAIGTPSVFDFIVLLSGLLYFSII